MKWIIILALIAIVVTLGGAGAAMLKKRPGLPTGDKASTRGDPRMAWALALRVALSVALFLLVLLAWWLGWITPRGVPIGS